MTDIIAWLNSPSLAIFIETRTQYLATRALLSQLENSCSSCSAAPAHLSSCLAPPVSVNLCQSSARTSCSTSSKRAPHVCTFPLEANALQSSSSHLSTIQHTKVAFSPIIASKINLYPERFSNEEIFGFSTSEGYVLS